jgi:NAD(P)-dependent dehydrogenase (short-subunit alcohol dehydrogenase family)
MPSATELRALGTDVESTMPAPREKSVPVTEQTSDSYAAMFDTTVLGTLLSLKHKMQLMQPQGTGTIVNISSTERGAANLSVLHRQETRRRSTIKCATCLKGKRLCVDLHD